MSQQTQSRTLECGHADSGQETVSLPGVGSICRKCHRPHSLDAWDRVLRSEQVHHRTGETTTYQTRLIGLDAFGRAIYHDERKNTILRVVPMHDRSFAADRDGDERPLREYPGRHNPARGNLINGPDSRDLVVAVDQIPTDSGEYRHKDLAEWLVTRDGPETMQALTEFAADWIESYAEKYDKPSYVDDAFPVEEARALLERVVNKE